MSIKSIIQRLKQFFCRSSHTRLSGSIKFFDRKKRFGFIVSDKNEYFFHAAATHPNDFKSLQDGVAVTFIVVQGKKGPQADNVEIVR
ncbi:MAG: cold shock domain-containing protein [Legionellaceae bacterium]|nr:cold shock domain-containing protein [Legionellaceae bacterium]